MSTPIFFIVLLCTITVISAAVTSPPSTAYEILTSYNFPPGILPIGATTYTLNPTTGDFSVQFNGTCSFSLEGSYQLRYKSEISGRIEKDRLRDLKGVSVKVLFVWLSITEVDRRGDNLGFYVGIASASFPVDNFDLVPHCGCGLVCLNKDSNWTDSPVELRGTI